MMMMPRFMSTRTVRDSWEQTIRHEVLLIKKLALLQRTFRLCKILPTWTAFLQTEFAREMQREVEEGAARKFRAWWELALACGDLDEPENLKAFAYSRMVLATEILHRKQAKFVIVNPAKFGVGEEKAAELSDFVKSNFEALTLGNR